MPRKFKLRKGLSTAVLPSIGIVHAGAILVGDHYEKYLKDFLVEIIPRKTKETVQIVKESPIVTLIEPEITTVLVVPEIMVPPEILEETVEKAISIPKEIINESMLNLVSTLIDSEITDTLIPEVTTELLVPIVEEPLTTMPTQVINDPAPLPSSTNVRKKRNVFILE